MMGEAPMETKKIVLVAVLICVLAGAWGFALRAPRLKVSTVPAIDADQIGHSAGGVQRAAGEVASILEDTVAKERAAATFEYEVVNRRNPMMEPSGAGVALTDGTGAAISLNIQVTGIAWDRAEPMAVVNNRVVRVGDMVGDARVVRVAPGYIVVRVGEQELAYGLKGNSNAELPDSESRQQEPVQAPAGTVAESPVLGIH